MFCAVIVAAGGSRRVGFDKLTAPLAGVPVLCRSVRTFAEAGAERIIVVCPAERWNALRPWEYAGEVPVVRAEGGQRRCDSVCSGLAMVEGEETWVAVHDGARPLVTPAGIRECLAAAQRYGAAVCAHPVTDTLKRADADRRCTPEVIDREGMWGMETPQIFRVGLLRRAYAAAGDAELTDEVTAVRLVGVYPYLVHVGNNPKITYPGDLAWAEAWCARESHRKRETE